jgi:hypothetical protein
MKPFLFLACAALCFAGTGISVKQMESVQGFLNDKFRAGPTDPYDLLGTARGTYMPGYGTLFTVEMELVYVAPPSPFRRPYSPEEIAVVRERKLKKLAVLKETMRSFLVSASSQLDGLPLNEHIAVETLLWHYNWEDSKGIPQRVFMTAEKGKLLEAQASHADLTTVIEEQER